jgi:hypothetical protein
MLELSGLGVVLNSWGASLASEALPSLPPIYFYLKQRWGKKK